MWLNKPLKAQSKSRESRWCLRSSGRDGSNMDFSGYENSTVVLDGCAQEQLYYWKKDCNVDGFTFLESNGCNFVATQQSFQELLDNPTQNNLFSSYLTTQVQADSQTIDYDSIVISKTDGSITSSFFDDGYKLEIESVNIQSSQTNLWDNCAPFRRAAKSDVDKSNIYYTRENDNCWVLTNDSDQIKAIELTSDHFLRPTDLLVWMVCDSYINKQKAVWVYEKMREKDPAWVPKNTTFAQYFRKTR